MRNLRTRLKIAFISFGLAVLERVQNAILASSKPPLVANPNVSFAQWAPAAPPEPTFIRRLRSSHWSALYLVAFAVIFGVVTLIISPFMGFQYPLIDGPLCAFGVLTILSFWNTHAPAAIVDHLDDPGSVLQFPVSTLLFTESDPQSQMVYGVITFSGDLLHFDGPELTFELPKTAAKLIRTPLFLQPLFGMYGYVVIRWSAEGHNGALRIQPYRFVPGKQIDLRREFAKAIREWMTEPETDHSKLMLPPLGLRLNAKPGRISTPILGYSASPLKTQEPPQTQELTP